MSACCWSLCCCDRAPQFTWKSSQALLGLELDEELVAPVDIEPELEVVGHGFHSLQLPESFILFINSTQIYSYEIQTIFETVPGEAGLFLHGGGNAADQSGEASAARGGATASATANR